MARKSKEEKKKQLRIYIPLTIVFLIVLTLGIFWYRDYMKYLTTDDAFVDSDRVSVSAKIMGRISGVFVKEGDTVKKGALLVVIDSTDLLTQKAQALAQKGQAEANIAQSEAKLQYDTESIKIQEVNLERAKEDYNRAKAQFEGEVISKEQYDHTKKTFETAQVQLDAAKSQLKVSQAAVNSARSGIETSRAQIGIIEQQLQNTRVYAPISGVVAKRWLLAGEIVQPGQAVLSVTNDSIHWVTINLEETKISMTHLGQDVYFTVDAYDNVTYTGKIIYIGSNTASQFSLIPPNNASGNFTKVTQRVPVKVSIDGIKDGKNLKDYSLASGMSAVVKIKK